MTDPTEIARVAAGLTRAQRWFVLRLNGTWTLPRDINVNGSHTGNRDRTLVESSHEGEGREYRLTAKGLAVRNHILREKSGG